MLEPWFATLARTAARAPGTPGGALRLRRDLGRIGRRAEAEMLAATGGVNTHRGALYSLGFLVAGAAYAGACAPAEVALAAGELARLPDIAVRQARSHGDLVRDQHPRAGAAVHAATGFPVTMRTALPALRASRRRGAGEQMARLDALPAVMAVLDDTCVLYRAGTQGLGLIRRDAAAVLAAASGRPARQAAVSWTGWIAAAGHGGSPPAARRTCWPPPCSWINSTATDTTETQGRHECRP